MKIDRREHLRRKILALPGAVREEMMTALRTSGREINTLGSKANEATMQKMVVEMKDELEKIKEQLLNIL